MQLVVRTLAQPTASEREVEVVERKGIGHPDTICDGVAENVCRHLCRYYLAEVGQNMHHNVDKVLLCGGAARPCFGGGEVEEPIELYLSGRATSRVGSRTIPVAEIAQAAAREWLSANLPGLDVARHVRVLSRIRPGSADLTSLFARAQAEPLANDTSCGAGFAPLTPLEDLVLAVERELNAPETKRARPEIGHDIKVMGVRVGAQTELTVGCAFVDRYLGDAEDYARAKAHLRARVLEIARRAASLEVNVAVNAADRVEDGEMFLTVTGTSAEAGDDGEVGRGNRANGLITPYRPMTLEAAAGKNPVTHVGKLYNLLAPRIAASLASGVAGVREASCTLVSRIGHPVHDPRLVDVALVGPRAGETLRHAVADIVRAELSGLSELRRRLLAGEGSVY